MYMDLAGNNGYINLEEHERSLQNFENDFIGAVFSWGGRDKFIDKRIADTAAPLKFNWNEIKQSSSFYLCLSSFFVIGSYLTSLRRDSRSRLPYVSS